MIGLALSLACLASSYFVQRRTPAHRPVTVALGVQAAVAALCLAPLPGRVQMAACAFLPVVSAWMYLRAWRATVRRAWFAAAITCASAALWGPYPVVWWEGLLPVMTTFAILVGGHALCSFIERCGPSSITQEAAFVSLAGDCALALMGIARELAPWQSRLVALALLFVHARWLVADRALRRSLSAE